MTSNPNDRQVGGTHYGQLKYQPWDFINDHGIPFIPGSAIKYISRWQRKGSIEDLEKALHFVEKCSQEDIQFDLVRVIVSQRGDFRESDRALMSAVYMDQFNFPEQRLMRSIINCHWQLAESEIKEYIQFNLSNNHKKNK